MGTTGEAAPVLTPRPCWGSHIKDNVDALAACAVRWGSVPQSLWYSHNAKRLLS